MLTANQEKAIGALLNSKSNAEAARKAGLGRRTIDVYMKNEEFKTELQRRRHALLDDATRNAQNNMTEAVTVLRDVFTDNKSPPAARIAAAKAMLEYGLRLTEFNDILKELEASEDG